ncbi:MAG: hypothetical protein P1P64_09440, partial [Treponemataceae bacterium]
NEGVNMANEVLLTVTEEERQIARELSEYKYQLMVQGEREEARKEGLAEGEERGVIKAKLETAKTFKEMGLSILQIAKGTGLTEEEIEKL